MLKLDMKDHKIINVLRENSRLSIRDIAKKTKLRPSTIHIRIKKLIDNCVIEKFTLKLNDEVIGKNFIVYMLISTDKKITDFSNDVIKEVYGITGEYDLILKMKFKGINEFNDFVIKFRDKHKLGKTLTMVATIKIKD